MNASWSVCLSGNIKMYLQSDTFWYLIADTFTQKYLQVLDIYTTCARHVTEVVQISKCISKDLKGQVNHLGFVQGRHHTQVLQISKGIWHQLLSPLEPSCKTGAMNLPNELNEMSGLEKVSVCKNIKRAPEANLYSSCAAAIFNEYYSRLLYSMNIIHAPAKFHIHARLSQ